MEWSLACPSCGAPIHAGDEDELVEQAERHIESEHPELIGRYTPDDLVEMAVPAES